MPMTENGFRKLTYAEILEAQITRAKDLFGNDIDTSEKSVLGKYIRLNTSDFAEQEAALEAVYLARYIDTATGISLDRLTPFANIRRNGATQAMLSVSVENTGTTDATIPMNTKLVTASGTLFHTVRSVRIPAGETSPITVECDTAGTIGNDTAITDFYQTQLPNLRILSAVLSAAGQDTETDAQLRTRWKKALAGAGSSTYDAIAGAVSRLDTVQDCVIFENDTDVSKEDGTGLMIPPHSFEAVVSGGASSSVEIAKVIFDKKSLGIGTAGTIEHTVKDAAGISHIIRFSYADTIALPVVMTIQTDALLPELYVKPIAEAVVACFQQNRMGQNVYPVSVCAAVLQTGLAETVTELAFTEDGNLQTPWVASAKQIAVCALQQVYIRNGIDAPYYHAAADGSIAAVADPWEATV